MRKISLSVLLFFFLVLAILPSVLAWQNNTFNNSLGFETLTFTGNQNITRYLAVPTGVPVINGFLNITGFVSTSNPQNLSAYWKFNQSSGDATDFFGIETLTNTNGVNYEAGKLGNASNFSGDKFFNSGGGIQAARFGTGNWTFAFWVNPTANVSNANIYANRPDGSSSNTAVQFGLASRRLTFTHTGASAAGSVDVALNAWTHIVIVKAGTNLSYWYNGTLTDSFSIPNDVYGNAAYDNQIGCLDTCSSGTENFRGKIDDFRIYNGYALNSTEITYIYNSYNGREYESPDVNATLFVGNSDLNLTIAANGTTPVTIRTSNLRSYINSYVNTCTYINGFCNVPFTFHSNGDGTISYSNLTFNSFGFLENSQTYNSTSIETAAETFRINISYDPILYSSVEGTLIYNGTSYVGTQSSSGNSTTFTIGLNVPLVQTTQNHTFYWQIALTNNSQTTYFNSSFNNQTVSPINLTLCQGTPYNVPYINFTFKNETASQESVTAAFSVTWNYYLSSPSLNKSITFTNSSVNPSYAFCFSPSYKTIYANPGTITYYNSYSVQRSYTPGQLTLSNSTTNTVLYLLPNSDGIYVSFQVVTASMVPISGAIVNATRAGVGLVEQHTTDDSGLATFFLNPNVAYSIRVSAAGRPEYTTTITPTQTSYTIILGSNITSSINDYSRGVTYSMTPSLIQLRNNTNYNFTFSINSTYWGLSQFGFNIYSNGTLLKGNSSTSSAGGSLSILLNTGQNKSFFMNSYWIINGSYINATNSWIIINDAESDTSVFRFFSDLKNYLSDSNDSDGLFGLKIQQGQNFGFVIILFLVIFTLTGLMSYKYGLTSPISIAAILTTTIFLFDVVIGIVPNPVGAISHFPTWFMGVVLTILIIREATL